MCKKLSEKFGMNLDYLFLWQFFYNVFAPEQT